MKEFTVKMKIRGKWFSAHSPNTCNEIVKNSKQEAEDRLVEIKQRWDSYKERDKKHFPEDFNEEHYPTEFKIMSREVTEWKDVK